MVFMLALIPATVLTIAGYLVLYASARAEGGLRTFGKYLGFWAFTLAGLVILGALFAAAHGRHHCPFMEMHRWHEPAASPGPPGPPPAAPPAPSSSDTPPHN